MGAVSGQATTFNLPNYVGPLFNITPTETVFLSMIGGLNGARGIRAKTFGFQTEDLPTAAQPDILEGADAPTASERDRTAVVNVTQIFHEAVNISYSKMGAKDQIGSVFMGAQPVQNELDHQVLLKLQKIGRDANYTFIQGSYNNPSDNTTSRKTRGLLTAISTNAVAAASARLSKALLNQLFRTMADNGAIFRDCVLLAGSFQKQLISDIYGYAPTDRNVGGVNIKQIETDFGVIGVVFERHMPAAQIAVAEISVMQPVFTIIPDPDGGDKGVLFYEPLAKTGAAEKGQVYGEIGLDHGPEVYSGKITGLATS